MSFRQPHKRPQPTPGWLTSKQTTRLLAALALTVLIALVAGITLALSHWREPKAPELPPVLLSTVSGELPANGLTPPQALADALLSEQDRKELRDPEACGRAIPGDGSLRHFWVSVALPPIRPDERLHFVRPALEPFCMWLYGAHTFSFDLVRERQTPQGLQYDVLHGSSADIVTVHTTHHEGRYDITEAGCTANECNYRHQHWQQGEYRDVLCWREETEEGKTVRWEAMDC